MKKKELKRLLKKALKQGKAKEEKSKPLGEWLEVHEKQLWEKGYKPQTVKNRIANVAHIRRLWGDVGIKAIQPHKVLSDLREQYMPTRASIAKRILSELRDTYANAVANGWADNNPALHVKIPSERIKRRRLTLEIWHEMREVARQGSIRWVEPMLLLALVTGQRRADLGKMAFSDVTEGCLRVEQQKHAGKGYGARVAIPLELRMKAIDKSVGEVVEMCQSYSKPGPTLLRRAGGGDIELSSLSGRFGECIRIVCGSDRYGPREWPSLHEVRSLSARLYKAEGVDVQTLLGHKHAEMTDLYIDDRGLSAKTWKEVPIIGENSA